MPFLVSFKYGPQYRTTPLHHILLSADEVKAVMGREVVEGDDWPVIKIHQPFSGLASTLDISVKKIWAADGLDLSLRSQMFPSVFYEMLGIEVSDEEKIAPDFRSDLNLLKGTENVYKFADYKYHTERDADFRERYPNRELEMRCYLLDMKGTVNSLAGEQIKGIAAELQESRANVLARLGPGAKSAQKTDALP